LSGKDIPETENIIGPQRGPPRRLRRRPKASTGENKHLSHKPYRRQRRGRRGPNKTQHPDVRKKRRKMTPEKDDLPPREGPKKLRKKGADPFLNYLPEEPGERGRPLKEEKEEH